MLIFDSFASMKRASEFARHVETTFGHKALVFDSPEESNKVDPFPFRLFPPIVLVERDESYRVEEAIETTVDQFGGKFAGT
jgi:hypothetical protein